ncbi:MAG: lysylphosphatidylglycerol synthase transmembrane domain-containing protein [bacterium]
MAERCKQILKFVAKLLVTVILLLWVFSRIDLAQFGETIKNARWSFLWIVWGLTVVAYWVLSIKMRLILKKQDCHASTGTLFGASAVTALYSMILPGVLNAPVKWYILRQHTGKGSNVFSSMVYNQFTTILFISIFALVALIVTNPTGKWHLPAICLALLVFLIVLCLSLLNRTLGPKLINYLSHVIEEPLPASFRSTARKILAQLSVFQTASWAFHFKVVLLNFVSITIVGTTIYIFAAEAARIDVPIGVLIWQCAVIFILGRLPISIANLGVREATLVGTLALYGVDAPSAFLMSMIIFSNRILMAIIGAVFQLCWGMQRSEN